MTLDEDLLTIISAHLKLVKWSLQKLHYVMKLSVSLSSVQVEQNPTLISQHVGYFEKTFWFF